VAPSAVACTARVLASAAAAAPAFACAVFLAACAFGDAAVGCGGGGGGLYTARARAQPRHLHPAGATHPALMGRAAHSVEAKAVVRHRSRRQLTPLPGLRCGTRLAHRASPPQRPISVARSEGGGGAHPPVPFGLSSPPPAAAAAGAALPSLLPRLGMRCRLAASSAPRYAQ
jgi:hypothetical protein